MSMNKIFWIILILLAAWTAKLNFDIYNLEQQKVDVLNRNFEQQTQRIGALYDQIVALQSLHKMDSAASDSAQKQASTSATASTTSTPTTATSTLTAPTAKLPNTAVKYEAQDAVIERLNVIQMYMTQQRFVAALENIQKLNQILVTQRPLSEQLNNALIEALGRDQTAITSYVKQRAQHQEILQQQLRQINTTLQPQALDQSSDKWHWSNWFNLSKVDQVPDMEYRNLHFKHMQLQLLIAQQALYAGQIPFYRTQIQQTIEMLAAYPDQNNRKIIANLQKLETLSLSNPPTISALSLLQGHG